MKSVRFILNVFFLLFVLWPYTSIADDNQCVLLLYHRFSDEGPQSTRTSPAVFEKHLEYLYENGYKVLPLGEVIEGLKMQGILPRKCVSLTADDGFLSLYTNAYPLLVKYQMPMSVFVSTESIDKKYTLMLSWQQLQEMSDLVDVYNHSVKHLHLVEQSVEVVQSEITQAQQRIQQELGVEEKFFAYPYGEFDDKTYRLISDLGYVGFGQHSGAISRNSDFLNLPRFSMSGPYAKMDSFTLKIKTLPMPIEFEEPQSLLISENFKPSLTLTFSRELTNNEKQQFSCFVSGQDQPELIWLASNKVNVQARESLPKGRSRYNCTMPSKEAGRYYWYSKLWLRSTS
jgi:peptidoglycan/xylan/chitin deacetylase (PgdA/CDA1 family)